MIDGKRLRQLREARGYTRDEFARLIDLGTTQVVRYEKGESDATGDVLARIAQLLNVSVDYLLGLTDNPAPKIGDDLSPEEAAALAAWRRGDLREAIKAIVNDE